VGKEPHVIEEGEKRGRNMGNVAPIIFSEEERKGIDSVCGGVGAKPTNVLSEKITKGRIR
jgi:hypothetical protein